MLKGVLEPDLPIADRHPFMLRSHTWQASRIPFLRSPSRRAIVRRRERILWAGRPWLFGIA